MAVSDVSLSAGMRSNLLMLQGTQAKLAVTQGHLATGNKVNSALDGPASFFAAKGLNQRAGDLGALKDAMGQAVSTINAGDKGITAIQSLVEQAKGLTTSAYGALGTDAASTATRKTLAEQFNKLKDQIDKLADDSGYGGKNLLVGNGMRLNSTSDSRGSANSITGVSNARVTNLVSTDTYSVRVSGDSKVSADSNDVANAEDARGVFALKVSGTMSSTLGSFSDISVQTRGNTGQLRTFTVTDGNEAKTVKFFDNTQAATASTAVSSKTNVQQQSNVGITGTIEAGDLFDVKVGGVTFEYKATSTDTKASVASNLVTSIQAGVTSGRLSSTDFAANTQIDLATAGGSTIKITANSVSTGAHDVTVSASATNAATLHVSQSFASGSVVSFTIDRAAMEAKSDGGNGTSTIQKNVNIDITATNLSGQTVSRNGTNQRGQSKLSNGENDFAFDSGTVRLNVDQGKIRQAASAQSSKNLVTTQQTDANTSNDITVNFNETRTNNITVQSQNVKTDGQGLRLDSAQNAWTDRADIDKATASVDFATNKLRGASQTLSTNLNVITTRESFTKEFSDVLTEGAGKLTLSDQNEEGATMLMLQTRQQLGTISLSLANQQQQAILRLF